MHRSRPSLRRRAPCVALLACGLAVLAPSAARAASPVPDKPVFTWRRPAPEIDELHTVADLAVDADGSVFVLDTYGCRVIRLSPAGELRDAFGGCGRTPGRLFQPDGLALSPTGTIYVLERALGPRPTDDGWPLAFLHEGRVQAFDGQGRLLHGITVSAAVASPPDVPGTFALPAALYGIAGIAVDAAGVLHVIDAGGARLSRYAPDGRLLDAHWLRDGVRRGPLEWASGGLAMHDDGRIAWCGGSWLWQVRQDDPGGPRVERVQAGGPIYAVAEQGCDVQPSAEGGWWLLNERGLRWVDARGRERERRDLALPGRFEATYPMALALHPEGDVLVGFDLRGAILGYGEPGAAAPLMTLTPDGLQPFWGRMPAPSAWGISRGARAVAATEDGGLLVLTSPTREDLLAPWHPNRSGPAPVRPSGVLRLDALGGIELDQLAPGLGPDVDAPGRPLPSAISPAADDGFLVADPGRERLLRYDARGRLEEEIALDDELPISLRTAADGRIFSLDLHGWLVERDARGLEHARVRIPHRGSLDLALRHGREAFPFGLLADGRRVWYRDGELARDAALGRRHLLRAVDLPGGEASAAARLTAERGLDEACQLSDLRLERRGKAYMQVRVSCGVAGDPNLYVGRVDPPSGELEALWPIQDPALNTFIPGMPALPADGRLLIARSEQETKDPRYRVDPRRYDRRLEIAVWDRSWPTTWRAEAFANPHLAGRPVETRAVPDTELSAWHAGLPAGGSGRLERPLMLEGGTYDIRLVGPGGARLWLDGELLVDAWRDGGVEEIHARFLSGTWAHRVLLELRAPDGPDGPGGRAPFVLSFARRGPAHAIHLPWTTGAWGDRPLEHPVPAPSPTPDAYPGP